VCRARGIEYRLLSRNELDIAEAASVAIALSAHNPWAVINAAGFVRVDDAETATAQCWRENADGPAILAAACARRGVALVTFSSDLVFDGSSSAPYVETDTVAPLNAYGRSKADAERRVLDAMPRALVIRTSSFFGPWDDHNIIAKALSALAARAPFSAAMDAVVSPTFVPDLVHTTLDLLIDQESGVWHVVNDGAVSWAELIRRAASLADVDTTTLDARPMHEMKLPARRPLYSALSSGRAVLLPPLDDALVRFVDQRAASQAGAP
jgi:dTDP-4-dehydrorhamnose reductase